MPITCAIDFKPLPTDTFGALDYQVMEKAFATHQYLGSLADELVYQSDFTDELILAGFNVSCEVPVVVSFETFSKTYLLDMVVNEMAVYELKTVARLTTAHWAQLLNYLLLLDLERGKLVNFRPMSVETEYVNASLSGAGRRRFTVDHQDWSGPPYLDELILRLLQDWGTGLELSLYHQAVVHLLGGTEKIETMLPMNRCGHRLRKQRFHLATPDSAFRLTAFGRVPDGYNSQLTRLLRASPLDQIHWINIDYHQVTFKSIRR